MTTSRYTRLDIYKLIQGYSDFVVEKMIFQGWRGHILTFMFHALAGPRNAVLKQMESEIERVYATMLTRIVRNPLAQSMVENLPIWIACPDVPVPKYAKKSLRTVTVNEGLHVQAVCLIPPRSRMKETLATHVVDHQGLYAGQGKKLSALHAEAIENRPDRVTDYVLKSVSRRRFSPDQIIVLPRSRAEMRQSP